MIIEKSENGHDFFSTEWIDKEIRFVFTDITADGISAYFRPCTSSKFLNVNQDINTTSNETGSLGFQYLAWEAKRELSPSLYFSHPPRLSLPSFFTVSPQSPS